MSESETARDKAVIIKREAQNIIDCVDTYKGKHDFDEMKKSMKLIWTIAGQGVAQIEDLERRLR